MIKKDELNIIRKNDKYRIAMKQSFLLFFNRWVEITWKEEDNVERPIEFKSFNDAVGFVDAVSI